MENERVARALINGMASVIRGKQDFIENFIITVLARGHLLLEDFPGLGKTTAAKTFARLISDSEGSVLTFKRIQFTPDLLPYDITGVDIFDTESRSFRFVPGPIFANIVLADEINRTTPKVQSALLEVMAEGQVTVGNVTRRPADHFMVIATQNPVESEGIFPLPVAELDRFMMRLSLGYPEREAELSVLNENPSERLLPLVKPIVTTQDLRSAQDATDEIFCHPDLKGAIADIVRSTRTAKGVILGASPRAGLHLLRAAKAAALVRGRYFVTDEDILSMAPLVLAHRLKVRDPRSRPELLIRELAFEHLEHHKTS